MKNCSAYQNFKKQLLKLVIILMFFNVSPKKSVGLNGYCIKTSQQLCHVSRVIKVQPQVKQRVLLCQVWTIININELFKHLTQTPGQPNVPPPELGRHVQTLVGGLLTLVTNPAWGILNALARVHAYFRPGDTVFTRLLNNAQAVTKSYLAGFASGFGACEWAGKRYGRTVLNTCPKDSALQAQWKIANKTELRHRANRIKTLTTSLTNTRNEYVQLNIKHAACVIERANTLSELHLLKNTAERESQNAPIALLTKCKDDLVNTSNALGLCKGEYTGLERLYNQLRTPAAAASILQTNNEPAPTSSATFGRDQMVSDYYVMTKRCDGGLKTTKINIKNEVEYGRIDCLDYTDWGMRGALTLAVYSVGFGSGVATFAIIWCCRK